MTYLPFYTAVVVLLILLSTKLSYEKELQEDDKEKPLMAECDELK